MTTEIWQDREVAFDIAARDYVCRLGEVEIDSINSVEDTKGNNGIRGSLMITNLRLLWCSHKNTRVNLSIGLNCIVKLKIRNADSKLRGSTQALYVMARYDNTKYEFIFTSLVNSSPRLFTTVLAVNRAYETSRLYRELKLRGAIIRDNSLKLVPDEEIYERVSGVWNLSSDQGNLGTFVITNIRLVWFANLATNFNVSIPYLQIKSIWLKGSKFGDAIVVETSAKEGGYVLGFKVNPVEKMAETLETLKNLHKVFSNNPNFGVSFTYDEAPKSLPQVTEKRKEDDARIVEDYDEYIPASFSATKGKSAYITRQEEDEEALPEYNYELGCAVQKLPEGTSIASLWSLVSS